MKADTSLHKQAHDKRGIAESLHAYITRAKLTVYEVGVFLRNITTLENTLTIHFPWAYFGQITAYELFQNLSLYSTNTAVKLAKLQTRDPAVCEPCLVVQQARPSQPQYH